MSTSCLIRPAKYELALCELFHPAVHGLDASSSPAIAEHFLIYNSVNLYKFTNSSYRHDERRLRRHWGSSDLLYNKKYIRLEIIQADVLTPGAEQVAYLKTFWLRIVQRCWKKIYKARQELIKKRSSLKALQEKQRTGQWPVGLRNYPAFNLRLCGK